MQLQNRVKLLIGGLGCGLLLTWLVIGLVRGFVLATGMCVLGAVGCDDDPPPKLAPAASALASAKAATSRSYRLKVQGKGSKVSFVMEAPLERIHGELADAVSGEIFLDPTNLTKARGRIQVDLSKLVLFQQVRENDQQAYGERKQSELQNQHARTWLQISDDGPTDERKKNALAQFSLTEVIETSANDLTRVTGSPKRAAVTARGDLLLHQRKAPKTVALSIEVELSANGPRSIRVQTKEPFQVDLDEHDVRPREAFSKLAEKTLAALGAKVDKTPKIAFEFRAALDQEGK